MLCAKRLDTDVGKFESSRHSSSVLADTFPVGFDDVDTDVGDESNI